MRDKGIIPRQTCWVDAYNQCVNTRVTGTIYTGVSFRNMHFVNVKVWRK